MPRHWYNAALLSTAVVLGRCQPALPPPSAQAQPAAPADFAAAKKVLRALYAAHPYTFYCHCRFVAGRWLQTDSCGYLPEQHTQRSQRVEWEHLMPAARFGHTLPCWGGQGCQHQRGRRCCRQRSPRFRHMEADMHNLVPAVGELNAARAHFDFALVAGEARRWGRCDFEVNAPGRQAEAKPSRRGDIARAYLYMAARYRIRLRPDERRRYQRWHRQDPPDTWERQRHRRIAARQHNHNPWISGQCSGPVASCARTR